MWVQDWHHATQDDSELHDHARHLFEVLRITRPCLQMLKLWILANLQKLARDRKPTVITMKKLSLTFDLGDFKLNTFTDEEEIKMKLRFHFLKRFFADPRIWLIDLPNESIRSYQDRILKPDHLFYTIVNFIT